MKDTSTNVRLGLSVFCLCAKLPISLRASRVSPR